MAEFKLMGRFIALSDEKEVASNEAGKAPIKKRELYMDCTRVDYYTKQPIGQENKVLLDFGGERLLDKVKALNLQKDDVIAVEFNIIGTPYKDRTTGKSRVFTSVRCYDVEVIAKAGQDVAPQPAPAPAPAPQPQPQPQNDGGKEEPLPF
jgi:hypothetical protein